MGNQLVIPSQGEWYEEFLSTFKIKVKNCIDSGTFFLTLNCLDQDSKPIIVKAYEYIEPLDNVVVTHNCKAYFQHLLEKISSTQGILCYSKILINDRHAFLIRPKMQYTLSQRLCEYPRFEEIEKMWVVFQILSSVLSLHELGLVHNGLNPDNVFCDWDTHVTIGDMAPFKPTQIRKDKPNVFHHYFSTASRSGCYLAPEQIMDSTTIVEHLLFNNPSFSSDYFSIGCIIYYIFTGHHLFTFSSLIEYSEGRKSIEEELNKLPVCIRSFAANLLSNDPNKRNPMAMIHKTFPSCFSQILNQFFEFYTNNGSLSYFVSMIPVFNALVEEQDNNVRIILTNIFSRFILTSDDQKSIITFSFFLVDFASPLSEEIILCRILPNIVELLSSNSASIVSTGLRCIVKLLESCKEINKDLESIIQDYLIKEVVKVNSRINMQIRCTIAETAPMLIMNVNRLVPSAISSYLLLSHFIIDEASTSVVTAFLYGFEKCIVGGYSFLSVIFPVLLSSFNNGTMMYKSRLLEIIIAFYENATEEDKKEMRRLILHLTQATIGFIQDESNELMMISFLSFLDWACTINAIDDLLAFDLFKIVSSIIETGNKSLVLIGSHIIDKLPKECKESVLPEIVISSINQNSKVFTFDNDLTFNSQNINQEVYTNGDPLITKTNSVLMPKLNYSSRILTQRVTGLTGVGSMVLISSGHELVGLSSDKIVTHISTSDEEIKSLTTMKQTKKVLIAYENKNSVYDLQSMKMNDILPSRSFDFMKSINSKVFVTAKNNAFAAWDSRMKTEKPICEVKIDETFNISDICSWSDEGILYGIGCKEGVVYTLDSRVWKTISLTLTPPVKNVIPVFRGDDINASIFVTSESCSCCYDLLTNDTVATMDYGGFGCGYLGRVLLASDEGTFFVDTSNFQKSHMLFDMSYGRTSYDSRTEGDRALSLAVENVDNCYNLKRDKRFDHMHLPVLHGHSSHITAFTHCNSFVTGDDQGFVNIWSL